MKPISQKDENIRSTLLREAPNGERCVRCGAKDGTVVLSHYTGPRSMLYGKGRSIKPHDICGAHLCHQCHFELDSYSGRDDRWARSEEFLHLTMLTIVRLIKNGTLVITNGKAKSGQPEVQAGGDLRDALPRAEAPGAST